MIIKNNNKKYKELNTITIKDNSIGYYIVRAVDENSNIHYFYNNDKCIDYLKTIENFINTDKNINANVCINENSIEYIIDDISINYCKKGTLVDDNVKEIDFIYVRRENEDYILFEDNFEIPGVNKLYKIICNWMNIQ